MIWALCFSMIAIGLLGLTNGEPLSIGKQALNNFPIIDGHNDLAYNLERLYKNQIKDVNLYEGLETETVYCSGFCATDLKKLREGRVGAVFWSVYVSCKTQYHNAVSRTIDQIDVIKRIIQKYPNELKLVTTSQGLRDAIKEKKIASLLGMEGGHSIDSKLSVLRAMYDLGVRYMTLTHTCSTPWAGASPTDSNGLTKGKFGLSDFGKIVIKEMNRLGMIVDLSHVSHQTMKDAIAVSAAPVIFSHSSAWELTRHHRNVKNDILSDLARNNGVIMVTFVNDFVNSYDNATLEDVANHINHIVDKIGHNNIGIGGDFDGTNEIAVGLEDVSKYPDLFDHLHKNNPSRWTMENLEKLAGRNILRVFEQVEHISVSYKKTFQPFEDLISVDDLTKNDGLKCVANEH